MLTIILQQMMARMSGIPSPEALQQSFKNKGTSITNNEARMLVVEVEKHHANKGKPEPKEEIAASAVKTVSRIHGIR